MLAPSWPRLAPDSYVEVTVGESGDGMVGVTAVDGQLAEGDSVVVWILR